MAERSRSHTTWYSNLLLLPKFCEAKSSSKKLIARLADIIATESVQDLVYGKPHPLKGDRAGQFALSLEGSERLVFEPCNNPIPSLNDGSIDWSKVTEVCIVFIGDYHD